MELERDGYTVLRGVLGDRRGRPRSPPRSSGRSSPATPNGPPDRDEFRYQMLNHGPCSQAAVGHPAILAVIEPLLGDDCHVIANTAWRNPPEFGGGPWHCDAGPTCRGRRASTGTTASRTRCSRSAPTSCCGTARCECGPTAVVPGQPPLGSAGAARPARRSRPHYDGRPPVLLTAARRRRGAVRVRRLAPRHAGRGWRRPAVPPGALRPARHRPADPHRPTEVNQLTPEAIERARHTTPAPAHRPPRPVLLRRLTGARRSLG